jgi:preprotein translocase subunit SecE
MADTEKKTMSQRFAGLKSEFSKIVWPEPQAAWKQTVAVVLTSVVIAFIIVILDYVIQYGVDFLVNL